MKVYVGSRLATIIVFGFCLLTIICGSEAEIDPKSIVAIYLFDNDTRDAVVDLSANSPNGPRGDTARLFNLMVIPGPM